jgi:hypothetical protein
MGQETLVRFAVAGAESRSCHQLWREYRQMANAFSVAAHARNASARLFRTSVPAACTVCIGTAKIGIGRPFDLHDRACLKN